MLDKKHYKVWEIAQLSRPCFRGAVLLLVGLCCVMSSGCSRTFWRQQADQESYRLLADKMTDTRWALPRMDVTPDVRSRLFDPYDPDAPPLPPDDPAAHRYMHAMHQDGKLKGHDSWHEFGKTFSVENPQWLGQFGLTPEQLCEPASDGAQTAPALVKLSLPQALELSTINSREYQTEIENLYLAALDLTFERFRFNVRYLGFGGEPGTDLEYESIPDGRNSLASTSRFGVSQLLPSGAQWIVELTNNTLWVFSGNNSTSTSSIISYSLVQPLLRGAGRKVVLENLTQQERAVLYETRDLARFRKTFFTNVVTNYLGLLLQIRGISNLENNISLLEEQLMRLREEARRKPDRFTERLTVLDPTITFPPEIADYLEYDARQKILIWTGPMSAEQIKTLRNLSPNAEFNAAISDLIQQQTTEQTPLELVQLDSRYVSSQNSIRQSKQRYQNSLDEFKILLGLPTDFEISIDESIIQPFQLIDPILMGATEQIKDYIDVLTVLNEETSTEEIQAAIGGLQKITQQFRANSLNLVIQDSVRVKELVAKKQAAGDVAEDGNIERLKRDTDRDLILLEKAKADFEYESQRLELLQEKMNSSPAAVTSKTIASINSDLIDIRERLIQVSQSLQVLQIGFRVELIQLEDFTLSMSSAVAYALENRLDLMNARAEVMDARRQLEVIANDLESVLDLRVEGNIGTPVGTRPFDFRGSESSFRAGVGFTAPLDQISERNSYRAALINYQRAKRSYMDLEDRVKEQVRQSSRTLAVLKLNFETARQSVRINARQYDLTVELANSRNSSGNQGLNILNALDSVLSAQNQLIGIWIDYESNRLNIHRDMGMMEIDEQGIWNDTFYQGQSSSPALQNSHTRHFPPQKLVKSTNKGMKSRLSAIQLASGVVSAPPSSRPIHSHKNHSRKPASVKQQLVRLGPTAALPNQGTIRPLRPVSPPLRSSGGVPARQRPVKELNENKNDQTIQLHPNQPVASGRRGVDLQRLEQRQSSVGWRSYNSRR